MKKVNTGLPDAAASPMAPSENHMLLVNCSLLLTITYPPQCGTQNQPGLTCLLPDLSWTHSSLCVKPSFLSKSGPNPFCLWFLFPQLIAGFSGHLSFPKLSASHMSALPLPISTSLSSSPFQILPGCSGELSLRSATLQVDGHVSENQGVCRLQQPHSGYRFKLWFPIQLYQKLSWYLRSTSGSSSP